eukprot:5446439-Amphidinium_carterae.1
MVKGVVNSHQHEGNLCSILWRRKPLQHLQLGEVGLEYVRVYLRLTVYRFSLNKFWRWFENLMGKGRAKRLA